MPIYEIFTLMYVLCNTMLCGSHCDIFYLVNNLVLCCLVIICMVFLAVSFFFFFWVYVCSMSKTHSSLTSFLSVPTSYNCFKKPTSIHNLLLILPILVSSIRTKLCMSPVRFYVDWWSKEMMVDTASPLSSGMPVSQRFCLWGSAVLLIGGAGCRCAPQRCCLVVLPPICGFTYLPSTAS